MNINEMLSEQKPTFPAVDVFAIKFAMQPPKKISSQINCFGYDEPSKVLCVEFVGGATYAYQDVPKEKFEALKESESAGRYIGANIKIKAHKCTRIGFNGNKNRGE